MAANDYDPNQPPAGAGSPTVPASFGGPVPPGQTPPPGTNPQVVYTSQSGQGYDPSALNTAWGGGGSDFAKDPANARVGDILKQYGYGGGGYGGQSVYGQPPPAQPAPQPGVGGLMGAGAAAGGVLGQRSDDLFHLLMGRAKQSETVDPNDPVIKAQTDAYSANNQRAQRSYLTDAAEKGGPNANLEGVSRSMAEQGAQATGGLQASLMNNELTARRQEIQNALQESGSLLTADQQLQLQRELGLIDSNIRQQGVTSGNDQFMARLGLDTTNQANYWDAIKNGLL